MILLLDKNEELTRSIEVYSITRTRELNGENTIEIETNEEIFEGDRIVFQDELGKWNEYIISSVDIERDDEITYTAYGENSSYELFYTYIDDLKPRNELAKSILARLLEDTRFKAGFVEDVGKISTNFYHTNTRNCIYRIVESLGCEIDYRIDIRDSRIVGRYVDLYKKMGSNNGKRFTYKKDLNNIKKTIDYSNICSKLYGYGKGEEIVDEERDISEEKIDDKDAKYGRRINFADVNGGKKYVENNDTRLKYGIGLERKHLEGVFVAEDCEDKEELLRLTKEELEKRSKPKISYEVNVEDISKYQDMGGIVEGVGLGDEVLISDKSINEKVLTRVIKIVDHPFTGEDMDITLGNYFLSLTDSIVETERLKRLIENRDRLIGEEIKRLATMTNKGFLRSVADRLNKELNNTDGFVYFIPDKGIRIYDKPIEQNPTKCIELGGGHLRIANKKLPNGEFDFTSFGTGDGFTASLIVAGILKGGKVEFDLENGTFLIGESINNFSMYWDGKTLRLRNVDIDLSNNSQIADIENNITNIQQDFRIGQGSLESKIRSIDGKYNDLSSRITQTNSKIESEVRSINRGYNNLSSRITQTESSISSKVSKGNIISEINQSYEGVKIRASKIDLDGNVNVSGTFETEGSTYDGSASSRIKLEDGAIQFWDKSNGDYAGQIYAYNRGINIQAGKSFGVWAGNVAIHSSTEMYLTAKEKMNLYPYGGLDINGSSNFKSSVTFYNSIYFDNDNGNWRIAVTTDGQQLFIVAPNGKRWNFDKYSGFFSKD